MDKIKTGFDVLILFGNRKSYATTLRDILRTIGLSANLVEDLPDQGRTVPENVQHNLPLARVIIGIASPDASRQGKKYPSAAFVTEATLCIKDHRENFILLQEQGTTWPSTLTAPVYQQFSRDNFGAALPKLLSEIMRRLGMGPHSFHPPSGGGDGKRDLMVAFMTAMDMVWDDIAAAWTPVFEQSLKLEAHVAVALDALFTEYHRAFTAYRDAATPSSDTSVEFKAKLDESLTKAEEAGIGFLVEVLKWYLEKIEKDLLAKSDQRISHKDRTAISRVQSFSNRMKNTRGYKSQAEMFKSAIQAIGELRL